MSNSKPGIAALAVKLGKVGLVSIAPSGSAGMWQVSAKIIDVRKNFGRTDYLVEPVLPATGPAVWIESGRVCDIGGGPHAANESKT